MLFLVCSLFAIVNLLRPGLPNLGGRPASNLHPADMAQDIVDSVETAAAPLDGGLIAG